MPALNVRLEPEEYTLLEEQAAEDDRSLNAQIKWLIKQEAKRRREDPDVVMTTMRCYLCGAPRSSRDTGWERCIIQGERRDVCPDHRRHALLAKEGLPAWGS